MSETSHMHLQRRPIEHLDLSAYDAILTSTFACLALACV